MKWIYGKAFRHAAEISALNRQQSVREETRDTENKTKRHTQYHSHNIKTHMIADKKEKEDEKYFTKFSHFHLIWA